MDRPTVRVGDSDDFLDVMRILDAGLLEAEAAEVRAKLDAGDCLVGDDSGRVVGALVLDGDEIDAVAVSPSRRGRGVGSVLVEAAAERRDRLVAEFDAGVRPFYEALGFTVERAGESEDESGFERFRGVRDESR
ncbi:GNAT family N-acetyltransferase [Haloferax namakaokahaiae]|uniref:GNAT family N-acetyltransferase n=1 Tax=Haloferax namakaokahaiae TaxID=1748331 RepID=A0ABD5ZIZ4_9EURY